MSSNSFVLWGSKGHGKVLLDVIGANGGRVVALIDNDPDAIPIVDGLPVHTGLQEFLKWVEASGCPEPLYGAVAVGGIKGRDRVEIALALGEIGVHFPSLIHPSASVSPASRLGHGVQVLANAVVAAGAIVGDYSIVNNSANVDHECALGMGVHVAPGAVLCGCVQISDYAFVGANAVVLPRIRIGERSVVGAGAVVTSDVPPDTTVIGCPARHRTAPPRP